MIRLGFTGTRRGLEAVQNSVLYCMLCELQPQISEARHGGCVGADVEFHDLLFELGLLPKLTVYPGHLPQYRAKLAGEGFKVEPPQNTLARNLIIVENSDLLIACPGEYTEVTRSGTWMTWRLAKKLKRRTLIIYPDGEVKP